MSDNSLHDKIAKILRLAGNEGATEDERAAAMAQAQKLAFKHNLDLGEINLDESTSTAVGEHSFGQIEGDWREHLLSCIALANFCRIYFYRISRKTIQPVIVGRPHNVEVVKQMFQYLAPQMEAEALREVSRRGQLPRYALIAVQEFLRREAYCADILEKVPKISIGELLGWGQIAGGELGIPQILDSESPEYAEALIEAQERLAMRVPTDAGLEFIMELTGIAKAYAAEVRPYIKRGELAPEVVTDLKAWKYAFQMAMAQRVYERLLQERKNLEDEAGEGGRELVLREDRAAQEYIDSISDMESEEKTRKLDPAGYAHGRAAADNIDLTQRQSLTNRKELGA